MAYLKDAAGIYRAAIREGLVEFNPFTALEAIDTSDSLPRQPFTTDEFKAILAAAPSREWYGLTLAAAFTGLRLGDCSKLSWGSIDLEKNTITLVPSKTKNREVKIPIHPDLLAYIEDLPIHSDEPDAPLFPTLSKTNVNSRDGLSQTFTKIMATAGVDRGKSSRTLVDGKRVGKGAMTWEKSFHSLHHSTATWLREAGVSEEDRMDILGHTTREVHQGYSKSSEAAARTAIDSLPSINSNPRTH
jgi:integrase